jgi:pilus assembly protein FimV
LWFSGQNNKGVGMARKLAAVVFSMGCLQAGSVMALGLGELTLESFLNEPLRAKVDLLDVGGLHEDQIRIRLATREDFDRLGVDRAYFLTSLKFDVSLDDNGKASIRVSSEEPVLEPYLDFIVEARWPSGRLLREYTVLVDPPVFDTSTPVISASERVEEVEGIPAPAKKKPGGPETASGTRVDVKKSELGPGEMPDRNFNAAAASRPAPGSRYMVHRDDTLWEIAQAARPQGASVHQTMLDIQRLNPDAFIDGNINRVKAGYIIYLPDAGDISSEDVAAALEEVRQQNEDWRAGRASEPVAAARPSLRISAEPEPGGETPSGSVPQAPGGGQAPAIGAAAALEDLEKVELERDEMEERLGAMEEQVETLQRIVSLKDDQIAALQSALAEKEQGAAAAGPAEASDDQGLAAESRAEALMGEDAQETADSAPQAQPAPTPAKAAEPAPPKSSPADDGGGMMSYVFYGLGALLLAILGFLFLRRRGEEEEPATADDVFADVELQDQTLEVEEPEPLREEPEQLEEPTERGYGERKHDEYASDMETGDALAEADIYIAYGRYPQAVELMKNAIANEPANPAYRLKLLEMLAEMGDREAAMEQLSVLESIDDPQSLERAREVMSGLGAAVAGAGVAVTELVQPEEPDLTADTGELLESDFTGLEIEEPVAGAGEAGELDLSRDFGEAKPDADDEDLVIATEANGMSTKLDLARAYLDMGDEDGARQILEEVLIEGSEEQKTEASVLLERIG